MPPPPEWGAADCRELGSLPLGAAPRSRSWWREKGEYCCRNRDRHQGSEDAERSFGKATSLEKDKGLPLVFSHFFQRC